MREGDQCAIQYTPMYASPEVIQAEQRGQATLALETFADMWSFGIMAFEVLTGAVSVLVTQDHHPLVQGRGSMDQQPQEKW